MDSLIAAVQSGDVEKVRNCRNCSDIEINRRLFGQGATLLHYACNKGYVDIARVLVAEFNADLSARDFRECTPLHYACTKGHVDVVRLLVSEFKADLAVRMVFRNTPLHCACGEGHVNVVRVLVSEFKADLSLQNEYGKTPLHSACNKGQVDVVKVLVSEFEADLRMRDLNGRTPLYDACLNGHLDVVRALVSEFKDDLSIQDKYGETPLHIACKKGHLDVARVSLSESEANLSILDTSGRTALMLAARGGHEDVVLALLRDYQCPVTDRDNDGWGALHHACAGGSVSLVQKLICDYKISVNDQNKNGATPLQVALRCNKIDVVFCLVNEFQCDPNTSDHEGITPLHCACEHGNIDIAHTLLQKHKADVNARDEYMYTPLHVAALKGHDELILALIREYGSDPNAQTSLGLTPLHRASCVNNHKAVQTLLKFTSPLVTDNAGNTPLHLAVENIFDCSETVQCLLDANSPVLIRNNDGLSPLDKAKSHVRPLLQEHVKANKQQILADYEELSKHAKKKYSGSHNITRVFVLGYPGAGKSSFIESLKREGLFQSFSKVSESSVPRHTAGIIPSVHISKQFGRVLFYDFAGDVEYYSSHAAIFESLASSRKGNNIFIVVADMRKDDVTLEATLHYWFSFIQYQKFSNASFLVVGSHLDQVVKQHKCLEEFCATMQPKVHNIKHFTLDCRDPRSNQITQFKKQIFTWVSESQKYELSSEARLLLGLLEKDFSSVVACPVQILVSHIKASGVWLPVESKLLHQIILELHEVGVLLLLGDCTKDDDYIILNMSKLTHEVHELLFSESALSNIKKRRKELKISFLNNGILPESILREILPPHITKECLVHLQYCQQISHGEVGLFPTLEEDGSASQSFLFFPALCSVDKSQVSWDESTESSFGIGWLALCTDPHDYFPPRFLHVLLLRLVYGFTHSPTQRRTTHISPEHSRRCTMWKNGVHWLMEEGVDCMVELVNGSKGVVVLTKSSVDGIDDCVALFSKIVSCVMEAKAEFCHSAKPELFLLDSSAEADCLNEDHQFAVNDVERTLESPEGKRVIISVSGRGKMELSKLQCMRRLTYWNALFPITGREVLRILEEVVDKIFDLGLSLGASWAFLESLRADFPSDLSQRRIGLVSWWMKSSPQPPCWFTLAEALIDIGRRVLADDIRKKHGLQIQLQEKILCEKNQALKPDMVFLDLLASVVGSRWPSLAVTLALGEEEIEKLKGKVGLSQQELSLQMLKIWASREEATYGQLCNKLSRPFHSFSVLVEIPFQF